MTILLFIILSPTIITAAITGAGCLVGEGHWDIFYFNLSLESIGIQ